MVIEGGNERGSPGPFLFGKKKGTIPFPSPPPKEKFLNVGGLKTKKTSYRKEGGGNSAPTSVEG